MSEINVVPYIDVMLVLLVIFMVTAPLMNQGIKIDLPQSDSKPLDVDADELPLVISVKKDSTYYINVGNEEKPIALAYLGEQAGKIIEANPTIKVFVEGDKSLPYEVIINLMNILQLAGATNVNLITEPPT
ncbi:MAG: protein TolR [Gammaproteobacteria bacterium TMED1]|nr:MAG: protein TolR [Gammaproteobacteria bacterium TMED1]|tara:strand:- start:2465 stop:2857 length:393 start_codon:yes stop_codon:yes gene_type:complete